MTPPRRTYHGWTHDGVSTYGELRVLKSETRLDERWLRSGNHENIERG